MNYDKRIIRNSGTLIFLLKFAPLISLGLPYIMKPETEVLFMKEQTYHTISHDVINQFVYLVTPTSDTTFEWYVNLNGKPNVKATFTAEGRKKNCLIRLEEIERISSLHRKENESNAQLIKNPCLLTYLHRLQLRKRTNKIVTQAA